jgi:thiol:disulfide interchange protein DsbD
MKKITLLLVAIVFTQLALLAQPNPVTINVKSQKTADKSFAVSVVATVQPGWHIYSQNQPDDAIAIPTVVTFNSNPLMSLKGKLNEVGKMQIVKDKTLGVSAYQYANEVSWVQNVELKAKVKTNLTGTIEYQVCDDEKCLPPKKVNFTIPIR